jgi:hypothetical protein
VEVDHLHGALLDVFPRELLWAVVAETIEAVQRHLF